MADLDFETTGVTSEHPPTAWGFGLCWLLFAATTLNYMDRQAVSLVGTQIKQEFRLDNEGFGWVLAAFALPYALVQVPAGYMADRGNVRRIYAGAVAWWSLAGMAAAVSPGLGALLACRVLLGIGESFNWPCALRVTAAVLPPKDRGLGNGIFNSGAAVGAVVTPLVVPPLALRFGWRIAFAVVGGLGLIWVVVWLRLSGGGRAHLFEGRPLTREPGRSTRVPSAFWIVGIVAASIALCSLPKGPTGSIGALWPSGSPRPSWAHPLGAKAVWWGIATFMLGTLVVARILPRSNLVGSDWSAAIGEVVRRRRFWVLLVVSISINVGWHSLINWLPTYLKEDRGMTFLASGMISAIPFLAADAGNLLAGWIARRLAAIGIPPSRARLGIMTVCAILIGAGTVVGRAENDVLVIALLAVMALGAAGFMALYFAFCQEVDASHTGLVVGLLGGVGNLFVAAFLPIAGKIKDTTGSFAPVFLMIGLLPILGLLALAVGWGRDKAPDNL